MDDPSAPQSNRAPDPVPTVGIHPLDGSSDRILGAAPPEVDRSVAARAIGRMASASGLFCAHFEHRLELPLPEWWQVPDADLGPYPWEAGGGWRAGTLHETKFRTFRLDRRIGSFHPAHAAKWSTHELCHGLIGFGWRPGASALWLATAARLAELVPVALWYFFDEAGLARCPRHAGQGALFGPACPDCEDRARRQPGAADGAGVRRWRQRGRTFVEDEIDAAWRTLSTGIPVSNRYGTLDLCTDGLAYTRAHGPVFADPVFAEWVERFYTVDRGWHDDLDSLVGRCRDVVAAVCDEGDAPPLAGHAGTRVAQDLGWRFMQLRAEVEGEVDGELERLVSGLAEAAGATLPEARSGIAAVIADYEALFDSYVLPPPADLFAVGYPLPGGYGTSVAQLAAGIEDTLPLTRARLGADFETVVERWARADRWQRCGVGDRFAAWARDRLEPAIADQAALEAALVHVAAPDPAAVTLGAAAAEDARWVPVRNSRRVRISHDVGTDPEHPGTGAPFEAPVWVCVVRGLDGAREVLAVEDGDPDRPPPTTTTLTAHDHALIEAGLLVPDRWDAGAGGAP